MTEMPSRRPSTTVRANQVRFAIRDLKLSIKAGTVDWVDCLRGSPPSRHELGTKRIRIGQFLRAVSGLGEVLTWEILRAADVRPEQRLSEVGFGTRQHLARLALSALNPLDPRLGNIDAEAIEVPETATSIDEPPRPMTRPAARAKYAGGPKLKPDADRAGD